MIFLIFDQKKCHFWLFLSILDIRWGYNTVDVIDCYKDLDINKFGQSFKLLGRVLTMETAIFTQILISLTWENRSKMNVNYKLLGLLPHFRILQLQYYILRQNYNKNGKEIEIWG